MFSQRNLSKSQRIETDNEDEKCVMAKPRLERCWYTSTLVLTIKVVFNMVGNDATRCLVDGGNDSTMMLFSVDMSGEREREGGRLLLLPLPFIIFPLPFSFLSFISFISFPSFISFLSSFISFLFIIV